MPFLFKKLSGEALKPQGLPTAQEESSSYSWLPDLYQFYELRSEDEEEEENFPQIHKITLNSLTDDRPHISLKIVDIPVNALLDCGSNLTFINASLFRKLRRVRLRKPANLVELRTADGSPLEILGEILIPYTFHGKTRVLPTLVAPSLTKECICGMDFWRTFGIYPAIASISEIGEVSEPTRESPETRLTETQRDILEETKRLFKIAGSDTLDTTPLTEHKIVLKEEFKSSKPV